MPDHRDELSLAPRAFAPLPLGSIRPDGWLLNQLRSQAGGLSGHLDEFWPDVAQSAWIGGDAEGWERGPYWLDGIVPLAYLLDDAGLKQKARYWVDYILEHQHTDGWLGPTEARDANNTAGAADPWPRFVLFKALSQYHEATGDARIIEAMLRAMRHLDDLLDRQPLAQWARYRWADLILSLHWLYERRPERWLLLLAAKVRRQGYDWGSRFAQFRYTGRIGWEELAQFSQEAFGVGENEGYFASHVVNNAMGLKAPGVWYRQSRITQDWRKAFNLIAALDKFHGQATGIFTGDEHLAGKNPSQGTELCAVAECMYSLEVLASILGNPALVDRLERIAFNALPATFKPDMWAHQYDQQANQAVCRVAEDNIYTTNGPDANIFGLEPNFGCCTANMHQAWPKFATHLWMGIPAGGLAAIAYAPCKVATLVRGTAVAIAVETQYPFGEEVRIRVEPDTPSAFPIALRIPGWCLEPSIEIDGVRQTPGPGSFHTLEREWRGGEVITLRFPMAPRIERRFNNSIVITRGPLVYSLAIEEEWRHIGGKPPHGDYEVHPLSPWNYALAINPTHPEKGVHVETAPPGLCPFSPEGAPVRLRVRGRQLPEWTLHRNAAAPPPQSPVSSRHPIEELSLIPYGCTNLRITEFPLLTDNES